MNKLQPTPMNVWASAAVRRLVRRATRRVAVALAVAALLGGE